MIKKSYVRPEIAVVELDNVDIIAASGNSEPLGDGGDIFDKLSPKPGNYFDY